MSIKNPLKKSVLFVCSANQCRSPMAMSLFSNLLIQKGEDPDEWQVASAGCWAYPGFLATDNARKTMQAMGLSLEDHRSQAVTESLLDGFKLVLCMEYDHKRTLQRNFPANAPKIYLLSEMVERESEVNDPVGLSTRKYQSTAAELQGYLEEGFEKILQLAQ